MIIPLRKIQGKQNLSSFPQRETSLFLGVKCFKSTILIQGKTFFSCLLSIQLLPSLSDLFNSYKYR